MYVFLVAVAEADFPVYFKELRTTLTEVKKCNITFKINFFKSLLAAKILYVCVRWMIFTQCIKSSQRQWQIIPTT